MGGNGYVEDFPLATLFRQSPLNSIWEGSGNVIALDILRAAKSIPILLKDIKRASGMDKRFDEYVTHLERSVLDICQDPLSSNSQKCGRYLADRLAIAMQTSIMLRFGNNQVL
jgi:putative acyl-CoA dehydrogenase